MFLFYLLFAVSADVFVALRQNTGVIIDVFSITPSTCILQYTLTKPCDGNLDFTTSDMSVSYKNDYYYNVKLNDTNKYIIFNPNTNLPGFTKDMHFIETIYSINNTNTAFVNNTYDVYSMTNDLLFTISDRSYMLCLSEDIQYDQYFIINTINNTFISEDIVIAHVLSYFYQYSVLCTDLIPLIIVSIIIGVGLIVICIISVACFKKFYKRNVLQSDEAQSFANKTYTVLPS